MKKRFKRGAALLLTLAMLLGLNCVPASAAVTTDGYKAQFTVDFDANGSLNNDTDKMTDVTKTSTMPTTVTSPIDATAHGNVVELEGTWQGETTKYNQQFVQIGATKVNSKTYGSGDNRLSEDTVPTYQKVKLSADILIRENFQYVNFGSLYAKWDGTRESRQVAPLIKFTNEGKYTDENGNVKGTYTKDTWYRVSAYIDFTTHTYKAYLDDTYLFDGTVASAAKYGMAPRIDRPANAPGGKVYVDNLVLSVQVDPTFESVTPAANSTGFPVVGGAAEFAFSNPLDTTQTIAATVSGGGANVDATATVKDNKVVVTNKDALEFDTDYTFTVPAGVKDCNGRVTAAAQSVTVHTAAKETFSTAVDVTTEDLENPAATITVTNPGKKTVSGALIIAAYDEDGNLVDFKIEKKDDIAGEGGTAILTAALADVEGADKIYVYAVDGETLSKPLTPSAIEITSKGAKEMLTDTTPTTVALDKFNISGEGEITVGGSVTPAKVTLVYINVQGPKASGTATVSEGAEPTAVTATEKEPSALIPVLTDADGKFELKYTPETFVDGEYTVSVGGWQAASVSDTAYCLRQEVQDAIVNGVNSAETKEDVETALAPYKTMMKVDASAFCDHVYQTLLEQKSYGSVEAVIEMMEKAQSLLKTVNSTNWADLAPILTADENVGILFKGYTAIETFAASETAVQNKICSYMTLPVESFTDLRAKLTTAMAKYKDDQEKKEEEINGNQTILPSGGSRPSTSNSSKGSSASVSYASGAATIAPTPTPSATPTPSTTVETPFADMKDAAWASEHVASLAEKGIISGDADGNFRPNDAVTREEFVKLLVGALGIEVGDAAESFADADIDAWYAKYLAAAKAAGIITGNEDGTFGVGNEITRQDMAVMAVRAVNAIGKTLPSGGATFTDSDSISSYAAQAVGQMQEAGILNGIGNGTFAPMDSTSRAAAAKVIDSLMNLVIGK